jgi:hypothetical protein
LRLHRGGADLDLGKKKRRRGFRVAYREGREFRV